MFNLVKMNIYRMLHSRSIYVLMLISILFALITVSMISTYPEVAVVEEAMREVEQDGVNIQFGITSNVPINDDGTIPSFLEYYIADIASGIALLFMIIGSVLFVNKESKSGFIKNIATQTKYRINIYISKIITLVIYVFFSMIIYGIAEYIMLSIYYKGDMVFGINVFNDFIKRFLIFALLYIAFLSGSTMLTSISKSTTLGITIGLLAVMGGASILYAFIDGKFGIDISQYTITTNIKNFGMMTSSDEMLKILLIGIGYTIVYNLIGIINFVKRDVV